MAASIFARARLQQVKLGVCAVSNVVGECSSPLKVWNTSAFMEVINLNLRHKEKQVMKKTVIFLGATVLLSLAYASDPVRWPTPYRSFKGEYAIYSGDLGDQQAPTRNDRKLSVIIEGAPAKEIFNAMPSDDKETCSSEKGARSRSKENVWCTFNPVDGYACYFGFDLRTGKSIAGGIC